MYITLILFLIGILGFILNRKNIISHTRKFLILEGYPRVDLRGPAFNLLSEGLFILTVTLSLSRFIFSGFFGRKVSVSCPLKIDVINRHPAYPPDQEATNFSNLFNATRLSPILLSPFIYSTSKVAGFLNYRLYSSIPEVISSKYQQYVCLIKEHKDTKFILLESHKEEQLMLSLDFVE